MSGGRSNILSNKALAYLTSKKATSILKSYEEGVGTAKFISNTGKSLIKRMENSSSNTNFNDRG